MEKIQFEGGKGAQVFLGRDTRPSGESLLEAAKQVWHAPLPPFRHLQNFYSQVVSLLWCYISKVPQG